MTEINFLVCNLLIMQMALQFSLVCSLSRIVNVLTILFIFHNYDDFIINGRFVVYLTTRMTKRPQTLSNFFCVI